MECLTIKKYLLVPALGLCITGGILFPGCYYDKEENLYPSTGNCDTANVTFAGTIQPLLQANCYACHSQAAGQGGIILEGHANVVIRVNDGKLIGAISHASGFSPMPKNGQKLAECEIKRIQVWINAGAPNN